MFTNYFSFVRETTKIITIVQMNDFYKRLKQTDGRHPNKSDDTNR